MSIFTGLTSALLIAALFTIFYLLITRSSLNSRSAGRYIEIGFLWLFLLVFLSTWTGALWVTPVGPLFLGASWIALSYIALIAILLLSAIGLVPRSRRTASDDANESDEIVVRNGEVNVFFWLVLVLLALAVVGGLLNSHTRMIAMHTGNHMMNVGIF